MKSSHCTQTISLMHIDLLFLNLSKRTPQNENTCNQLLISEKLEHVLCIFVSGKDVQKVCHKTETSSFSTQYSSEVWLEEQCDNGTS